MKPLKPNDKRHLDKTAIGFRLDLETYDRFTELCDKAGTTVSDACRQLIQEYVDKYSK